MATLPGDRFASRPMSEDEYRSRYRAGLVQADRLLHSPGVMEAFGAPPSAKELAPSMFFDPLQQRAQASIEAGRQRAEAMPAAPLDHGLAARRIMDMMAIADDVQRRADAAEARKTWDLRDASAAVKTAMQSLRETAELGA
jgi:hypothetical protein